MNMSVNLIEGNILTPPTRNENTIICHQVNCRAAMGAGLARQIRDKWPVVFDEYVKVCNPKKLGDFQVVQVAPQLYVANLFGQLSFGRVDILPTAKAGGFLHQPPLRSNRSCCVLHDVRQALLPVCPTVQYVLV